MNRISIESATELNKILSFLPENIKQKIPENILKKIADKADNKVYTKINEISDIKIENILPETRKYLSFIFLNYLATEEEKNEYIKIIKNNQEQHQKILNEKYNIDNIFDKKEVIQIDQKSVKEKENLLIENKESFFKIILNKFKSLFSR